MEMGTLTRGHDYINQHYVPQLLLRNWGDSFFGFNKEIERIYPTSPRQAAAENDFLTIEGERSEEILLHDREAEFGKGVQNLVKSRNIAVFSDKDRARASVFIALQYA